jgi:hypothetical protein
LQNIISWALASLIFIASFTCFAMGNASGAVSLLVIGFLTEFAFWLHCSNKTQIAK